MCRVGGLVESYPGPEFTGVPGPSWHPHVHGSPLLSLATPDASWPLPKGGFPSLGVSRDLDVSGGSSGEVPRSQVRVLTVDHFPQEPYTVTGGFGPVNETFLPQTRKFYRTTLFSSVSHLSPCSLHCLPCRGDVATAKSPGLVVCWGWDRGRLSVRTTPSTLSFGSRFRGVYSQHPTRSPLPPGHYSRWD